MTSEPREVRELYVIDVCLLSGGSVRMTYSDIEAAEQALEEFAEQLRKHPHDRARCHVAACERVTDDGVTPAPRAVVDLRQVAAASLMQLNLPVVREGNQ